MPQLQPSSGDITIVDTLTQSYPPSPHTAAASAHSTNHKPPAEAADWSSDTSMSAASSATDPAAPASAEPAAASASLSSKTFPTDSAFTSCSPANSLGLAPHSLTVLQRDEGSRVSLFCIENHQRNVQGACK